MTIMIIGILAAIALPSFLQQSSKAKDADAKSEAKTLLTAMRVCGIDQGGSFTDPQVCNLKALRKVEQSIPDSGVSANAKKPTGGFAVSATSGSDTTFTITRYVDGTRDRTCKVKDKNSPGGCTLTKGKQGVW